MRLQVLQQKLWADVRYVAAGRVSASREMSRDRGSRTLPPRTEYEELFSFLLYWARRL